MKRIIGSIVLMWLLIPISASAQVTFRNPLNTILSPAYSAYVDNNANAGAITDFQCGTFTYDGHTGVDFRAVTGTQIVAAANGGIYARTNECPDAGSLTSSCGSGYGNNVRIDHEGNTTDGVGLSTIYAHMRLNTVVGTGPATCGMNLGQSAASGKTDGPHLHFEVRTNGQVASSKVDPFSGSCSQPTSHWTAVVNGIPTSQCTAGGTPAAPNIISVSNPTANSLVVNFTDNATNETSTSIERKIGTSGTWGVFGSFSALTGTGTWNWTNTGLSSGTTYCYRLRAVNASGNSAYSNEMCGTTTSTGSLPSAPSNVTVTNAAASSLRVNFTDNATNETAILLERKIGTGGAWSQIMNFNVLNATGGWYWDNTGLATNTTYCYRLRAQNGSGFSSYSNEACGTTLGGTSGVPAAPSNLFISNPTFNSLQVNFTDNATNETSIQIERRIGSGSWIYFGYFNALAGASTWNWTNTGLSSGTTYCYRLRAVNASGNSAYSNEACGTTL